LFTHGRSAFDALEPVYTPGKVRYSEDTMSYGFVGVASRHGVLPAAVVGDSSSISVVVKVTGSFHLLEHDLFTRSSVVEDQFETTGRRDLFYETLEEGWSAQFCSTDATSVCALPRSCFVCIESPCCLPCLVQCGEGGSFSIDYATMRWFDCILKGVRRSDTGISRAFERKSPTFRFIFQRLEPKSLELGLDKMVDYENDAVSDDGKSQGTAHCASVDAIFHVARSIEHYEQQQFCSTPCSHTTDAVSPSCMLRAMPTSVCLRPADTNLMRIFGDSRQHVPFLEKIAELSLSRSWERRVFETYTKSATDKSAKTQILMAIELFTPSVVVIHRCSATHKIKLFRHGMQAVQIDFEEAYRLVHKHGIVFGFDEHNNDVFRSQTNGKNIDFRISDKVASTVMDTLGNQCGGSAPFGNRRILKRLREALGEVQ